VPWAPAAVTPGAGSLPAPFTDVPTGAYYEWASSMLTLRGITTGYGATDTFSPFSTVTRAQMAVLLYRMAGEPAASASCGFDDEADIPAYARKEACWLLAQGITTNDPYRPDGLVTRAQMAAFLWRFAGKPTAPSSCDFTDEAAIPVYARQATCWLKTNGITVINPYRPADAVTRAQMAAFLYRTGGALRYWVSTN
jgi:hypothetical protein